MKKYIILALFAILLIMFIVFSYYYNIWSDEHTLRQGLINKALNEVQALKKIDDVDYFTGVKEYYFIFGRNAIDIPLLVWLNEEEVHSIYLFEWITKEEIKQNALTLAPDISISRINAGINVNNILIYEVLYEDKDNRLGYQYYYLKNGEYINSYRLGKSR